MSRTKGSKNSTGLAVINSETKTSDIIGMLDAKLKVIKKITDTPYRTTGILETFGDIKTELKIENLIRANAMVMSKERNYNESAEDMLLVTYPAFSISGGSSTDWKSDIKLRIAILEQNQTEKNLTEAKDIMSKFMSEKEQRELALAKVAKLLV